MNTVMQPARVIFYLVIATFVSTAKPESQGIQRCAASDWAVRQDDIGAEIQITEKEPTLEQGGQRAHQGEDRDAKA